MAKQLIAQRFFVTCDKMGYDIYREEPTWEATSNLFRGDAILSGVPEETIYALLGIKLQPGRYVQCQMRVSKLGRAINAAKAKPR
jgi:hypothetical protein